MTQIDQLVSESEAPSLENGQVIDRRWATSEVRRIARPGRPAVYRKQFALHDGLGVTAEVIRRRTAREMELIRQLGLLDLGRRLGSPRLINGDPESGTLLTEEIPGRPLESYVLNEFRRRVDRQCLQAMSLAGRWLRHFQLLPFDEADRARISRDDPEDLVKYCDVRLQAIRKLGYRCVTDSMRQRVRQALARLLEQTPEADRRFVWTHADFSPGNILWDGEKLTPIDFAMSHPDFPLTDVTYFIHRLEMLRVYFPWRRWPLAAWRKAVLRGYGRPNAEQSSMYRALMIRHLCCRLKTYVRRRPQRAKERLHNVWVRWRVRKQLLEQLLEQAAMMR